MNNRLFYHNSTICLQDSSRKICGMHNFIMFTYMGLYLYNVCNKNMRFYIYKPIRFSVIVSVEYKSANTNVQGKYVMFVLIFICIQMRDVCTLYAGA